MAIVMKWSVLVYAAAFLAGSSAPALAAMATLSRTSRHVTAAEVAGGAPAGGFVHEFFITSSSDVLLIGDVQIDAPLFQHALGSDVAPPYGAGLSVPGITADSFITTPGATASIGGGFQPTGASNAWFDTSDDGPQENFMFARLTTAGPTGSFSGWASLRGYQTYAALPFNFVLPGSDSDMALLAGEPTFSVQYSLDPPPAPEPVVPPQPAPTTPPVVAAPPIETPPIELPAAPQPHPEPTPQPEPTPIITPAPVEPVEIVLPGAPPELDPGDDPPLTVFPIYEDLASIIRRPDMWRHRIFQVEAVAGEPILTGYPVEYRLTGSDLVFTHAIADWQPTLLAGGATMSAFGLSATALQEIGEVGVPEPASVVIALAGIVALLRQNRRRPR